MAKTALDLIVNLDVGDLERAIDFYTRALGLRLVRRLFDGTAAELAGAPCTLLLIEKPASESASSVKRLPRSYARHWTPVHLDFVVASLDAALARAVAAGAVQEGAIVNDPYGRLATFADPFGHGFCLLELSEQGYDAVEDAPRSSPSR